MTQDANGWPDPARPGVPLNLKKEGWHFVGELDAEIEDAFVLCWVAEQKIWIDRGGSYFTAKHASSWRYFGPALTSAEVKARITEAQRVTANAAAQYVEAIQQWNGQEEYCESCKGGSVYPDARDVAAAIRALGEKE